MTARQLRLVQDAPPAHDHTVDPTRQVFEHWVYMFGLHPGRTKLDAERRAAINAALTLYGTDDVLLAVEGMAAAPLGDKPESMRLAMREIAWFLAGAKRIERCLHYGDQLRACEASAEVRAADPVQAQEAADPVQVARRRERLRAMAEQLRASHG